MFEYIQHLLHISSDSRDCHLQLWPGMSPLSPFQKQDWKFIEILDKSKRLISLVITMNLPQTDDVYELLCWSHLAHRQNILFK